MWSAIKVDDVSAGGWIRMITNLFHINISPIAQLLSLTAEYWNGR